METSAQICCLVGLRNMASVVRAARALLSNAVETGMGSVEALKLTSEITVAASLFAQNDIQV